MSGVHRRRCGSKPGRWRLLARVFLTLFLAILAFAVAQADITLRFTVWDGEESCAIIRKKLREYEALHPGIHVNLENVDYNNYFTKLLTQFAAHTAPDVAMMGPDNFQQYAKRGALVPLNDPQNDLTKNTPGFDLSTFYPAIVKAHEYKGALYVLPRDIAPAGLIYYNKKAFDEAHVPYPDGTWTWDFQERPELREKDFLWVLHHLTKKEANGKTRYALTSWDANGLMELFLFSQKGYYADSSEDPTKVYFNDPKMIASHQLVTDLFNKYGWIPSPTNLSSMAQLTAEQMFSSQKSAMYMCGIWDSIKFRREDPIGSKDFFDWDIAQAPAYKDGTKGFPTGGSGYSIISSTPYKKEAWELIRYMAGEPGMQAMADAGIAQPAIRSLALKPPWTPDASTTGDKRYPWNRILTDQEVNYVHFPPTAWYWPEVRTFLQARQDAIWNGTLPPKEALQQAQDLAQSRLNDILREQKLPEFNWTGAWIVIAGIVAALIAWIYLPERRRRLSRQERVENRVGYAFISPWIVGTLLFTLGPMLFSLMMSFTTWDSILPAQNRGFGNYAEAFGKDPRFWKSMGVTALYVFASVPCGILIALALAVLLNTKVKGIGFYRTCFYVPALASVVASSLVWQKMYQQDGGLINSVIYGPSGKGNLLGIGSFVSHVAGKPEAANWLGNEHLAIWAFIIMSLWGVGGAMIILLAGLQGIPQFYYEAATLDGANGWQRFKTVTFPLLTPSLFFVLVTGVIGAFQVFTQVYVITMGSLGGPNDATRVFMIQLYEAAFKNLRMGYAAALAWILFAVILIFTLIQFRLQKRVYYEADVR